MSSDRKSNESNTVRPYDSTDLQPRLPEDVAANQDLYGGGTTADRAYNKFLARGSADGHDVEDWLSSEREIEDEQRASDAVRPPLDGARKPRNPGARVS
ncbi:MAG: DUF2934 domain-containing protein [Polyangia bacterium]